MGQLIELEATQVASDLPLADQLESIAIQIELAQNAAILCISAHLYNAREIFRYRRDEGGFAGWVATRLGYSRTQAYRLIDVYEKFGPNVSHAWDTLPRRVLFSLAQKDTDEEVIEEVKGRIAAGETVTLEDVKKLKEDVKKLKADLKEAEQQVRDEAAKFKGMVQEVDRVRDENRTLADKAHTLEFELESAKRYPAPSSDGSPVPPASKPMSDIEAFQKWLEEGVRWINRGSAEWRERAHDHLFPDLPVMDR